MRSKYESMSNCVAHRLLAIAIALALSGCGKDSGVGPPGSTTKTVGAVSIQAQSDTVSAGDTTRVGAVVTATDGSTIPNPLLRWSSSDTSIALIDTAGLIRTRGAGPFNVTVTAQLPGAKSIVNSTISMLAQRMIADVSLTRASATDTILNGDTVRISAVARDGLGANMSQAQFSWSVSDTTAASVDASGLVTARGMGPVTVTATAIGPSEQLRHLIVGTTRLTLRLAFTHIAAGVEHTCGVSRSGAIYCWGNAGWGELGDGIGYPALTAVAHPVRVLSRANFAAVSLDEPHDGRSGRSCGITLDGVLSCWGSGAWGMLGNGVDGQGVPPYFTALPVQVGPTPIVEVALGSEYTCALTVSGDAYCAGSNFVKQLGVDTVSTSCTVPGITPPYAESCSNTFVKVNGGKKFSRIFSAAITTCGLTSTGSAWCWGGNVNGEAGVGSSSALATPTAMQGGLAFSTLTGGEVNMCGITTTGIAYCWGHGVYGELGTGNKTNSSLPVRVATSQTFTHISAGNEHVCALTASGDTYCWGANTMGQLGISSTESCANGPNYSEPCSPLPALVSGVPKFIDITAGDEHTCGLVADGSVYCWGEGDYGELGNGATPAMSIGAVRVQDII